MIVLAALVCFLLTLATLTSLALAASRLRPPSADALEDCPPGSVCIVRPVCGLDPYIEETLASGFKLDYSEYELVFCVARRDDPVIPVVRRLMAAHPDVPSRLLVGDVPISANPKLNNCIAGWQASRSDWVVLADSNVLMPRNYLRHLLARWRPDTGLVCSTPVGSRAGSFWAEIECAFLNTLQARWQYAGEALGLGFAQGKTMLWRRAILDDLGGIRALAAEIAEDAAATKLVRRAGLHVHLVPTPFEQPLGLRTVAQVWTRQARWARLRRVTFPLFFAPEILTSGLPAFGAGAYAAEASGLDGVLVALGLATLWYGAEWLLALKQGWTASWRFPLLCFIRDCLVPAIWTYAWIGARVTWRGNAMTIFGDGKSALRDQAQPG